MVFKKNIGQFLSFFDFFLYLCTIYDSLWRKS